MDVDSLNPGSAGSADLARRFEAVVLIGDPAAGALAGSGLLQEVAAGGLCVALVTARPVPYLVTAAAHGAGAVINAVAGATAECWVADGDGIRTVHRPSESADVVALQHAAKLLADRLLDAGFEARIPAHLVGSAETWVELQLGVPAGADDTVALEEHLLARGFGGRQDLIDMAWESAGEAGVTNPRIDINGRTIRLRLSDEADAAEWVLGELWRRGIGPDDILVIRDDLGDGDARLGELLDNTRGLTVVDDGASTARLFADQLARRRDGEVPRVTTDATWSVAVDSLDAQRRRLHASLLTVADGHIGAAGASLCDIIDDGAARRWLVHSGVYTGEGPETHLLTGPVAFRIAATGDGESLRRVLDLHSGVLAEQSAVDGGSLQSVRFCALCEPGTAVLRAQLPASADPGPALSPPSDDPVLDAGTRDGVAWMRVAATDGGMAASAADVRRAAAGAGDIVLDRVAAYAADADRCPDVDGLVSRVRAIGPGTFDRLLAQHRRAWAERWEDADIVVEGDPDLQLAVRFALFHLMASVRDDGEAAIGARGLSGTSYRGHVFWDADTFTLPFLAATHPASARAMLEYRIRRLPAALAAARDLGRSGARFPWESAGSGRDVTPTSARDRTGKIVPIRTGTLEEHITAEVAWAACCYMDWTGDVAFAVGPGLQLLVETARYWASRIRVDHAGAGHIFGVIGPDEYHEPVDDNAFTNVMARWNLRRAADAVREASRAGVDAGVGAAELRRWQELAAGLVDGYDADTGIYEQFAGFSRLEPLIIEEVAPRRPIAADLLLGTARVHGAQVIKQADVLMLHHLVPDEVAPDSLEPNLRYYEPRTAHGSSLSPAIHASLFARARDYGHALEALQIGSRIDLDDLTASSAGGLHIATMGGLWQAYAYGFAGLRPRGGALAIDPRLPHTWSAFAIAVRFRGSRVHVRIEHDGLAVTADPPVPVSVGGSSYTATPAGIEFRRRAALWELIA